MRALRTARARIPVSLMVASALVALSSAQAQTATHTTVRHYNDATTTPEKPELTKAETAIEHHDFAAAEGLLKAVTSADPKDARAWYDLGYVYSATQRRPDAVAAYKQSVAADPAIFEANLNLGLALGAAGDSEAAKYLRAATTLRPQSNPERNLERAWLGLGDVLERANDSAGAVAAYREAEKLAPRDVDAHLGAAEGLEKAGDFPAAEAEFRSAAELDPKSKEAEADLINVYTRAHRLPEAEAELRKLLAGDPGNATARLQLGRVLAAENKNEEASMELAAAVKQLPGDDDALRELAGVHARARQYAEAAAEYGQLLQKRPNDGELHFACGTALMNQHDFPAAQRELLAAANLAPSVDVFGNLAVVADETHNYPLAMQALDARAKLAPDTPGTYYLRATIFDQLHDYKKAAEFYHRFLDASNGQNPESEWKAKHRLLAIEPKK